jgi:hypothetical protein
MTTDELRRKAGELTSLAPVFWAFEERAAVYAILRAVAGGRIGLLKPAFAGKPERVTFQAGGDVLVIGGGDE